MLIFYEIADETSLREKRERRLLQLIQAQDNQHKRQSHIRQICYEKFGWHPLNVSSLESELSSITPSYLDHLIVDEINKLIYCFVPKVASTNWKRVLLALNLKSNPFDSQINPLFIKGNESHVPKAFKTLNQYNITEIAHKLRYYMKFMFVRHPYERLLSAYRNKLEHTYSDYFRNRFGRKIVKQLRQNPTNESLEKGHDVTFSEFLIYITTLNTSDHKKEFNEHWRPIYDLCLPCLVDYDLIGKYETLHNDAQLVLWKARVMDLIKFPKREETYSNQPSSDLIWQYYSNISQSLIDRIATIYSEDLQLFQYSQQINSADNNPIDTSTSN